MGFPFFKMSTLAVVPTQAPIQKARGLLNGKAAVQRLGISVDVFPSTCKSISSVEMPHPNILRIYIFVATVSSACKSQTDEAVLVHVIKACRGGGINPPILNFGTRRTKWIVSRSGRFVPGETTPLPIERESRAAEPFWMVRKRDMEMRFVAYPARSLVVMADRGHVLSEISKGACREPQGLAYSKSSCSHVIRSFLFISAGHRDLFSIKLSGVVHVQYCYLNYEAVLNYTTDRRQPRIFLESGIFLTSRTLGPWVRIHSEHCVCCIFLIFFFSM